MCVCAWFLGSWSFFTVLALACQTTHSPLSTLIFELSAPAPTGWRSLSLFVSACVLSVWVSTWKSANAVPDTILVQSVRSWSLFREDGEWWSRSARTADLVKKKCSICLFLALFAKWRWKMQDAQACDSFLNVHIFGLRSNQTWCVYYTMCGCSHGAMMILQC